METLLEPTQVQAEHKADQARVTAAVAGSLAVKDRSSTSTEGLNILKKPFEGIIATDLPVELLHSSAEGRRNTINPSALDNPHTLGAPKIKLKDGSEIFYYDIHSQQTNEFGLDPLEDKAGSPILDTEPDTRIIVVKTQDGIRYSVTENSRSRMQSGDRHRLTQSLDLGILDQGAAGQKFMEGLGYLFVNGDIYAPSPQTFKTHCKEQGIEVEIFPEKSTLNQQEYLEAYANGLYPIGALDSFYSHDIQDDHITALLIGGPELQASLAKAIKLSLQMEGTDRDILAGQIDSFTASFRSILLSGGTEGEAYGKEEGRRTLKKFFEYIPIPPERIDELISIAQTRAQEFGLTPKELH